MTFKSKYAISPRLGLFLDVENISATPVAIIYRAYPDRMSAHYTFATKYVGGVTGSF